MFAFGKFIFSALGDIISAVATNIKNAFEPLGALIKAILTGDITALPKILSDSFKQGFGTAKTLISDLETDFQTLKTTITDNIAQGVDNALRGNKYELLKNNVDATGVTEVVSDAVKKGLANGAEGATGGPFTPQLAKVDLEVGTKGLSDVFDFKTSLADTKFLTEAQANLILFEDALTQFRDNSAEILNSNAENFAVGFGETIAAIATGSAGIGSIGALLLNTMADIAKQLGQSAIKIGLAMKALKLSFRIPAAAIIAGVGLVALSALLKGVANNFAGNFAGGGFVGGSSFTGDRLIAGVNSGELILNVAQQKNLAAALKSQNKPIVLQPSIDMDARKFRVLLNQVDTLNGRVS